MRPSRWSRLDQAERRLKRKPVDPLLAQRLRDRQKPAAGAIAGAIAAVASAMVWTMVVLATGLLLPVITVAIGAACGCATGYFGRGVEPRSGIMAVAFTVVGWLSGLGLIAYAVQAPPMLVLSANPTLEHFLFLVVGVILAYHSSFLWLSRAQKGALWDDRTDLTKRD